MIIYAVAIHLFKTVDKCVFSNAAATLSLSSNCLLMACSDAWVPGVMVTDILKRGGRHHKSRTLIDNPINVAILQWGIVGVNNTFTVLILSSTYNIKIYFNNIRYFRIIIKHKIINNIIKL